MWIASHQEETPVAQHHGDLCEMALSTLSNILALRPDVAGGDAI